MGSGISTKYEKTYFYSKGSYRNFKEGKEESGGDWLVSEDTPKYNAGTDTHTIEYYNDEKVKKFCNDMRSREPYNGSSYSKTASKTSSHFEIDEDRFFGKKRKGSKVRTIESDNPMETSMDFYSQISEGGITDYLDNHHGIKTELDDGTFITFRPYPKTEGSPAVEIKNDIEGFFQKIHFIKRNTERW